jgi:hypothetical protein
VSKQIGDQVFLAVTPCTWLAFSGFSKHICIMKAKFALEQATKAQRWSRYSSTLSLTSAVEGGRWSTTHLYRFTPWEDPEPTV